MVHEPGMYCARSSEYYTLTNRDICCTWSYTVFPTIFRTHIIVQEPGIYCARTSVYHTLTNRDICRTLPYTILFFDAPCCVLQFVAVCCRVLQCSAVCCSVLQYVMHKHLSYLIVHRLVLKRALRMAPWDHRPRQHTAALCSRRCRERLACCVYNASGVMGHGLHELMSHLNITNSPSHLHLPNSMSRPEITNSWPIPISQTLWAMWIPQTLWAIRISRMQWFVNNYKFFESSISHELTLANKRTDCSRFNGH